eukprot:TRINITY_DN816_c0_g2_i2.p1 TRINITY_DN816_c0_g2~~TRINITY_DN816_c0_g2_i2.p1  ORF type:complete len:498 (+),score=99.17 TRINITY_DN816_c0_g2_i2:1093-2586(+)
MSFSVSADDPSFCVREANQTVSNTLVFRDGRLEPLPSSAPRSLRDAVVLFVRSAFLPEGYPHSVSEDYLEYQVWDSLQAMCSSVTGVLSTQALLIGFGVGNSGASAATATVQWLVRDGTGMIGRILFAYLRGTELDCNAKRWRFVADILNDLALGTDLLAPLVPGAFLPMLCVSSLLKACVGVAGGATRAAITVHQAVQHNTADVQAKDGSQETAVGLFGLLFGLIIAPVVTENWLSLWLCFFAATAMHLYCNYRAVSCCVFDVLNQQRARLVLRDFLSASRKTSWSPNAASSVRRRDRSPVASRLRSRSPAKEAAPAKPEVAAAIIPELLHPREVAGLEGILVEPSGIVELGSRAADLPSDRNGLQKLLADFDNLPYLIQEDRRDFFKSVVRVWLKEGCTAPDVLRAFVHAELFASSGQATGGFVHWGLELSNHVLGAGALLDASKRDSINDLLKKATVWMDLNWPALVAALTKSGWKTDRHLLGCTEWRLSVGTY